MKFIHVGGGITIQCCRIAVFVVYIHVIMSVWGSGLAGLCGCGAVLSGSQRYMRENSRRSGTACRSPRPDWDW